MKCFSCGKEIADQSRFCPSCGAEQDVSSTPTLTDVESPAPPRGAASGTGVRTSSKPARSGRAAPSGPDYDSSDSAISECRFVPGTTLAERYRIVSLSGRGGMGEVYRADDLTLGQSVALKFLPEALARDGAALARFHREVRTARQVSHPNVCRVFDIGQIEGLPFLTMEYVDGEDLASLLRRIGRLPPDKAVEIARQLCAGLAAAHEHGVVHRDLKPTNIMLDGRGKVRITDFGLAGLAQEIRGEDVRAGTPAYMAPEQLAGKDVTPQSDIYSLGLVLYEIFTGKRAYDAATLPELMRQRERPTPASLTTLVKDIDPLVERVILRCLEKDPAKRPATALQVAAALPGGDPLQAALAAGETPSPEMVAAAGETEGMRPGLGLACLGLIFIGLIVVLVCSDRIKLSGFVPLENSPEVLSAKAREITRQLGYAEPPVDSAYGFLSDTEYLKYIREHDHSASRWRVLLSGEPPAIQFWYRQSPRYLEATRFFSQVGVAGHVTGTDPPRNVSGMVFLLLDSRGRLLDFEAVPPQMGDSSAAPSAPDWNALFSAAGLDRTAFKPVEPKWTPLAWGDARAAWEGAYPGRSDLLVRIEAAAYRGRPIYFDLVRPWDWPTRMQAYRFTKQERVGQMLGLGFLITILAGGIVIARRNVRLGRGDPRGAFRLALFVFAIFLLLWGIGASHVPTIYEVALFVMGVSWALFAAAMVWMLYVALEPYVRRHWPNTIISWSRLIAGQFRDPLAGRDLLVGVLYGTGLTLWTILTHFARGWFGGSAPEPNQVSLLALLGYQGTLRSLLSIVPFHMFLALGFFFSLFLLRLLLRKEWLAAAVFVLIFTAVGLAGDYPVLGAIETAVVFASIIAVLRRFGLVTLVVALIVNSYQEDFPTTLHLSAWYAGPALFAVLVVLAMAIYGFHTSLGGRPVFADAALDD